MQVIILLEYIFRTVYLLVFCGSFFDYGQNKCVLSPRKMVLAKCFMQEKRYTQGEIADRLKMPQASVCRVKKSLDSSCEYSPSQVGKCGQKSKNQPKN